MKAYMRRITVFFVERLLESVFFGVGIFTSLLTFALASQEPPIAHAFMSDLGPGVGRSISILAAFMFIPMAYFYVMSGYIVSCILFSVFFRQHRPIWQALVMPAVGLIHTAIFFFVLGASEVEWGFLYLVAIGLISVFAANYLGARLLQRWEARADRG